MKVSELFDAVGENQEIGKELELFKDKDGNGIVFKVRGMFCKAARKLRDNPLKDNEQTGRELLKVLIAEFPAGLTLEDGTAVTHKNLEKFTTELDEVRPGLGGEFVTAIVEFAHGHKEFSPKP